MAMESLPDRVGRGARMLDRRLAAEGTKKAVVA